MDLGRLDICLRCKNAVESEAFYRQLGFEIAEGDAEDGWLVMSQGTVRIGLFEARYMGEDSISLNFRNGNIPELAKAFKGAGIALASDPKVVGESGGSLRLRDPDGHLLFFDSEG